MENRYAAAQLSRLQPLVDELLADMDRVPDTEVTAPRLVHGHVYYESRGAGHDYWDTHRVTLPAPGSGGSSTSLAAAIAAAVRRSTTGNSTDAASQPAPQLVLDQNSLSAGHTYWDVVAKAPSPDGRRVAFLYDTVGEEDFTLQVGPCPGCCP
jgi:oligopeptidase B